MRIVANLAQLAPDAEGQVALIDLRHPLAVPVCDESVENADLIRENFDFRILKQFVPERLRGRKGKEPDRRSVPECAFALRDPGVEVEIGVLAERMLRAQEQALTRETLPTEMPFNGSVVETTSRSGKVPGIGEPGHVPASLARAERTGDRAPARWVDDSGVAPWRDVSRVGEGAARRPRAPGVVPVCVAYLFAPDDVEADHNAPLTERTSPNEAAPFGIGARLPRTGRAGLRLESLEIASEHDVDRSTHGVPAVGGGCAVAQYLDALYRREGKCFSVETSGASPVDEDRVAPLCDVWPVDTKAVEH